MVLDLSHVVSHVVVVIVNVKDQGKFYSIFNSIEYMFDIPKLCTLNRRKNYSKIQIPRIDLIPIEEIKNYKDNLPVQESAVIVKEESDTLKPNKAFIDLTQSPRNKRRNTLRMALVDGYSINYLELNKKEEIGFYNEHSKKSKDSTTSPKLIKVAEFRTFKRNKSIKTQKGSVYINTDEKSNGKHFKNAKNSIQISATKSKIGKTLDIFIDDRIKRQERGRGNFLPLLNKEPVIKKKHKKLTSSLVSHRSIKFDPSNTYKMYTSKIVLKGYKKNNKPIVIKKKHLKKASLNFKLLL